MAVVVEDKQSAKADINDHVGKRIGKTIVDDAHGFCAGNLLDFEIGARLNYSIMCGITAFLWGHDHHRGQAIDGSKR